MQHTIHTLIELYAQPTIWTEKAMQISALSEMHAFDNDEL